MISEFNTTTPGTTNSSSTGMSMILKLAIIGIGMYLGYKYLIKKPSEENVTG